MEERLLRLIQKANPWWLGEAAKTYEYKRKKFGVLSRYMKTKQILALVGLRRVGKTVLLQQLLHEVLPSTSPKNVLFLPLEKKWATYETLEDILYYFLDNSSKGQKFIFLDEIQKVDSWADILKRFYDQENDIKFVISGSASLSISRGVESLAGRIFDFHLAPLEFAEFLEMRGIEAGGEFRLPPDFTGLKKLYDADLPIKDKVMAHFLEYLFKGGFPEIVNEEDVQIIQRYIKNSVVEKILFEDLPEEFEIKHRDALRGIVDYAARETSGLYTNANLASFLGINQETAANYVEYLLKSFLIDRSYNFTRSIVKQRRASKKLYIALPSIAIAEEAYGREVLGYPEVMGKYVESLAFNFIKSGYEPIFFWRTPQKEEIDIVVRLRDMVVPIEVKYQERPPMPDALVKFMERFKINQGVVLTKDVFRQQKVGNKEVLFIPVWFFLLHLQPVEV